MFLGAIFHHFVHVFHCGSYVELYNECLRDLLTEDSQDLDLREDSNGNAVVCGVRTVTIKSAAEVGTVASLVVRLAF